MSTNSSFNNRVAHKPRIIELSPSKLTGVALLRLHPYLHGHQYLFMVAIWIPLTYWGGCTDAFVLEVVVQQYPSP
jgi:hypothetical protein